MGALRGVSNLYPIDINVANLVSPVIIGQSDIVQIPRNDLSTYGDSIIINRGIPFSAGAVTTDSQYPLEIEFIGLGNNDFFNVIG